MFTRKFLENGIPVVMEQVRSSRAFIIGIWVKIGSRHETLEQNGISHFLEHMFFKGTDKRSTRDIAVNIDSLGGDINAFTAREQTAFYVKVLDEYVDRGIELLTDIFLHSTFPEDEIEKERGVIKEEIKMVEDTPDDYVHDLFSKAVWGDTGLGQPVLGTRETVAAFSRGDFVSHIDKYYGTADTVISCAGNFESERVVSLLNQAFAGCSSGSEPRSLTKPEFLKRMEIHPKDLAEAHICIGLEGLNYANRERYALSLLNTILGSSISSRLYQEVREKKGYAYNIYSYLSSYMDAGGWVIYAGTGRKKATAVAELILKELTGLHRTIDEDELRRAKDQLKGNLVLALESVSSRMQSNARQEIYFGRHFSQQEMMNRIESVTLDAARDLALRLTGGGKISLTALGPVSEEDFRGLI
jgi:predicted Zn-dependent peptidase